MTQSLALVVSLAINLSTLKLVPLSKWILEILNDFVKYENFLEYVMFLKVLDLWNLWTG